MCEEEKWCAKLYSPHTTAEALSLSTEYIRDDRYSICDMNYANAIICLYSTVTKINAQTLTFSEYIISGITRELER